MLKMDGVALTCLDHFVDNPALVFILGVLDLASNLVELSLVASWRLVLGRVGRVGGGVVLRHVDDGLEMG